MAIKSYKLGPGSLTVGAAPLQISQQVRAMVVRAAEKVTSTEAIPVLSGEELAGDEAVDFDYTLVGNLIQDIEEGGVVDWSWDNKGTAQPFEFIPSTALGRKCTGTVMPVPLEFGGDVDKTKRAETPLSWRIVGVPVIAAVV